MFYGRGAGGAPTASAVLGDLVAVARNKLSGAPRPGRVGVRRPARRARWARRVTRYHVSLDVADRPGVLAQVAHGVRRARRVDRDRAPGGHGDDDAALVVVTHRATDAALSATVEALRELDIVRAVCQRHAGGGRREPWPQHRGAASSRSTATGCRSDRRRRSSRCARAAPRWCRAQDLSELTGCEVHLKVEGANPTGSFKDRGMTMAITKAVEEGATAVICASTGNTSASAAAYAVRAGMTCAVLVPHGKIALGKLAQALVHGARLLQVDGNFDDCLRAGPRPGRRTTRSALVNSVNPYRIEGQKTAAFEIVDALGGAPDVHCLPVGNAGNITAYWKGYTRVRRRRPLPRAADVGLPGRGRRADRARRAGRRPRRPSRPRSASATPRPGPAPWPRATSPAASSRR